MRKATLLIIAVLLVSCAKEKDNVRFSVKNNLDIPVSKTIEIPKKKLRVLCEVFERYIVRDLKSGEALVSQVIDTDQNGELEILVFRIDLEPGESRKFELQLQESVTSYADVEARTFSRFVPERIDDYAWENDKVAFRTYGPTAQKMVEDGVPGGTMSSGIDCWLKKVPYPIIDKWYDEDLNQGKSYHEDHGEGLDNFHVGSSRGCGGTGVWMPETSDFYISQNFTSWNRIATGPVRTMFELEYAPWEIGSGNISEIKKVSLDQGSNLMRVELEIDSDSKVIEGKLSTGLTLHENDGEISLDQQFGWFSYWQPHGDSEIGMGIVVPAEYLDGYTEYVTDEKDGSHLLVHLKPIDGVVVYYAGFGWKGAGEFTSASEWIEYLENFCLIAHENAVEVIFD